MRNAALVAVVLLGGLSGCIDPRLPYDDLEDPVVNYPPIINDETVVPPPGTEPVEVNIGENCPGASFSIGSVVDEDLAVGARLRWRWRVTPRNDVGEFSPPKTVGEGEREKVVDEVEETEFSITPFDVTDELLRAVFFGDVDTMVGQTHRLDIGITDGLFATGNINSLDVATVDAGRAYYYWLFRLEEDPCPEP